MKILVNCPLPFALAHGGHAIQITKTVSALKTIGVEVETVRWWDEAQSGDIIHYFGRMPADQIRFAQQKGIKVVMAELLTATGSRSRRQLQVQKCVSRAIKHLAPRGFSAAYNWDSYVLADACVALTPWEAHLMSYLFNAPSDRLHVVPNGVEEEFLNSVPAERGKWLVCTATITERKRVLELAQAAVHAETPVWIIGKAYSDTDPYAQDFFQFAARFPHFVRYEGAINDRVMLAQIYRSARGFILLSEMESLSLSALEAAACECPLLLSDLPWATSTFEKSATYCGVTGSVAETARELKQFYDKAAELPVPPKPPGWIEIAQQLKTVYEKVLTGKTK